MTRPLFAIATLFAMGCPNTDKEASESDDTGAASGTDSGTSVEQDAVWDDLSMETNKTLYSAYASGAGFYVVGSEGTSALRSQGDWYELPIDVEEEDLNGLWGSGSGEKLSMVAVGDAGFISTWSAGGWTAEDLGQPNFEAIDGPDIDNLMAVGWGGVYVNGGGKWEYETIDDNPRFNSVWFNGESAICVGPDGTVGFLSDGDWTVDEIESRQNLYDVDASSTSNAWAVGERGTVVQWDGSEWIEHDVGTSVSLWGVYVDGNDAVYVVGNNGEAMTYDGSSWSSMPTGVTNNLLGITGTDVGTLWAHGNRGATLRFIP